MPESSRPRRFPYGSLRRTCVTKSRVTQVTSVARMYPINYMSALARYLFLLAPACLPLLAQQPDAEFFETKIRPVLVAKCYGCHSSKLSSPMGGLAMDTKAGLAKGGASGPEIVPGKPGPSRLLQAIRYTNAQLQMPPTGKLPDSVIADFEPGSPPARRSARGRTRRHGRYPGLQRHVDRGRAQMVGLPARRRTAVAARQEDRMGQNKNGSLYSRQAR